MTHNPDFDLRYPIGTYNPPDSITPANIQQFIESIEALPQRLQSAVASLNDAQLDTPYRPGGWTVRQVIHHIPDSHMNSYVRFKWTLTEEQPTIKAYFEERWAELPDGKTAPVSISLNLLESLHARWTVLLRSLTEEQLHRSFIHPESGESFTLATTIGNYAWHGEHHLAHIVRLKERQAWI